MSAGPSPGRDGEAANGSPRAVGTGDEGPGDGGAGDGQHRDEQRGDGEHRDGQQPDGQPLHGPRGAGPPWQARRWMGRRWIGLALAGAALALAAGGVLVALTFDRSTLEALRRLGPALALVLAALMTAGWLAAAGRVYLLTRSLGHRLRFRDAFAVAVAGELGVAASPTGLGGVALRLGVLRARGVALADGTAVVGADLVLDGGVALLVTTVALPLALLLPGSRGTAREVAGRVAGRLEPELLAGAGGLLVLLLAAGGAVRWWLSRSAERRLGGPGPRERRAGGRRSHGLRPERLRPESPGRRGSRWRRWRRRSREAVHRVREGLRTLLRHHPRTLAAGFALALAQILCRYSILPVVVMALAGPANLLALYPLQGLLHLVAHLVVLPGGGGSVELGAGVALALFVPAALVGAVVLLWRLFTFHWNLFVGGAVFLVTVVRSRDRLSVR